MSKKCDQLSDVEMERIAEQLAAVSEGLMTVSQIRCNSGSTRKKNTIRKAQAIVIVDEKTQFLAVATPSVAIPSAHVTSGVAGSFENTSMSSKRTTLLPMDPIALIEHDVIDRQSASTLSSHFQRDLC